MSTAPGWFNGDAHRRIHQQRLRSFDAHASVAAFVHRENCTTCIVSHCAPATTDIHVVHRALAIHPRPKPVIAICTDHDESTGVRGCISILKGNGPHTQGPGKHFHLIESLPKQQIGNSENDNQYQADNRTDRQETPGKTRALWSSTVLDSDFNTFH